MNKHLILLLGALSLQMHTITPSEDNLKKYGIGAVIGAGAVVILDKLVVPWFSGKSEERERQRQIASAKTILARAGTKFSDEIALDGRLSKRQLMDVVTAKFGNKECKYYLYDQELAAVIAELEGVNLAVLDEANREKQAELLRKLHTLNKEKNLNLHQEMVADQQKQRALERETLEFGAKLDNEKRLTEITKELKGVVHEQNNNRSWTEEKLNNIGRNVRQEGQATRDMLRDQGHASERHWDRWERQADRQQQQQHQAPPPYNPNR